MNQTGKDRKPRGDLDKEEKEEIGMTRKKVNKT